VELLLSQYLQESYSANAYAVNVYVVPGPQAIRLTRISREDLEKNRGPRVECSFRKVARKGKASKTADKGNKRTSNKPSEEDLDHRGPTIIPDGKNKVKTSRKRKRQAISDADDELNGFIIADKSGLEYGDEIEDFTNQLRQIDTQTSEPEDDDWTFSMSAPSRTKSQRGGGTTKARTSEKWDDEEIITLSSD
jgi:ATP-dependent DNA helicase Q1